MNKDINSHILKAEHLQTGYDKKIIIDDLTVEIPDHKISVILGSNGSGKSTLLKTFSRLLQPMKGEVSLDGKSLTSIGSKSLARTVGLLPQSPTVPDGIRVMDLVARGRYPYLKPFAGMQKADYDAVDQAMDMMHVTEFAERNVSELSGGQRQRVWIAMALAQQTDILFLDEPTTYLDITYQVEILDLLKELNMKHKTTIVMVLHDLNLSARYADHLFAMKKGKLITQGSPKNILTEDLIMEMFNLHCHIMTDPVSETPMIIPISKFDR